MARLKGIDNLDDVTGKLTGSFNAVTLHTLEKQFKASAPDAAKVLTDFYLAAERLQQRENEFNRRAKPADHDLKVNLRNTEQLAAMRTFESAKQSLLTVNPTVGEQILNVVERNLASSTKPAPKPVSAKRSFTGGRPALA